MFYKRTYEEVLSNLNANLQGLADDNFSNIYIWLAYSVFCILWNNTNTGNKRNIFNIECI